MCLLLLAMVPAWAADLPQEVTDAAPPAAEELEGKRTAEIGARVREAMRQTLQTGVNV